jgi:hypothetical protein
VCGRMLRLPRRRPDHVGAPAGFNAAHRHKVVKPDRSYAQGYSLFGNRCRIPWPLAPAQAGPILL